MGCQANKLNFEGVVDAAKLQKGMTDITGKIIGAAFTVSNTLGSGFFEKVYENALAHEIEKAGLKVGQQAAVHVFYDGIIVENMADLLVEDKVIVEF